MYVCLTLLFCIEQMCTVCVVRTVKTLCLGALKHLCPGNINTSKTPKQLRHKEGETELGREWMWVKISFSHKSHATSASVGRVRSVSSLRESSQQRETEKRVILKDKRIDRHMQEQHRKVTPGCQVRNFTANSSLLCFPQILLGSQ